MQIQGRERDLLQRVEVGRDSSGLHPECEVHLVPSAIKFVMSLWIEIGPMPRQKVQGIKSQVFARVQATPPYPLHIFEVITTLQEGLKTAVKNVVTRFVRVAITRNGTAKNGETNCLIIPSSASSSSSPSPLSSVSDLLFLRALSPSSPQLFSTAIWEKLPGGKHMKELQSDHVSCLRFWPRPRQPRRVEPQSQASRNKLLVVITATAVSVTVKPSAI